MAVALARPLSAAAHDLRRRSSRRPPAGHVGRLCATWAKRSCAVALLERVADGLADAGRDDLRERRRSATVAADPADVELDRPAELVGAGQRLLAVLVGDGEDEGAAVGVAAAAGVPVAVGDRAEARVLARQAAQRGVDGLLLRADQADLHVAAVGQREDLRPQHRGVGDAQQLECAAGRAWLRAMMKNHGPSGEPWMCVAWICAVDPLLLRGQLIEVQLGRRRQRLDDVLQRVLVDAVPQVEELHRDLGVGQELRADVALPQVLADRVVVGEVAVVHQRLVHARRTGARRPGARRAPWWGSAGGRSRRAP